MTTEDDEVRMLEWEKQYGTPLEEIEIMRILIGVCVFMGICAMCEGCMCLSPIHRRSFGCRSDFIIIAEVRSDMRALVPNDIEYMYYRNQQYLQALVVAKVSSTNIPWYQNVIIANGKNTVTLTCTSGTANPVSDIQWSFDSIHSTPPEVKHELSEYGGKATRSTITLTPTRNDVGKNVTCTAVNEVNLVNPAISVVTLDLQFYPDVKVISQNTSSVAGETTLICNASGLPSTYIFSQVWTQEWPGYGRLRELTGTSSTLTLNQLTYEYSGVYSCTASNGILINDAGEYFSLGSGYL
ncbi:hypothetical protein DPMN_008696 [Dreissena polymorpha]|uniref:Ig-like domain-containing protein n=1 Tax=Dreissena polymorpha TaxID=45954 RepID=A0A9D4MYY1_DREPO|nr:hypothetical protein DPMN_008696 [Dreissena polymorpha]